MLSPLMWPNGFVTGNDNTTPAQTGERRATLTLLMLPKRMPACAGSNTTNQK
jgi:hypothetical protein